MKRPFLWLILAAIFSATTALQAQNSDELLRASSTARLQNQLNPPGGAVDLQTYEKRQEEMALERARKLRSLMKEASANLPKPDNGDSHRRKKKSGSTGITDGTWQAQRLDRIRQGASYRSSGYEPVRERRGLLETIGAGLDAAVTNDSYVERRRAGLIDENAGPLEKLGNVTSRLGGGERGLAGNVSQGVAGVAGKMLPGGNARSDFPTTSLLQPTSRPTEQIPQPDREMRASSPAESDSPGRVGRLIGAIRRDGDRSSDATAKEAEIAPNPAAKPQIGSPAKRGFNLPSMPSFRAEGRGDVEVPAPSTAAAADAAISSPEGRLKRLRGLTSREPAAAPAPDAPLSSDASRFVVSAGGAEFHPFGDSLASSHTPIPAGTVLTMDKKGDEWSAVKLPNGKTGLMRTKDLRRARESEIGRGSFVAGPKRLPPPLLSSPAPTSQPNRYQPTVDVPLPKLPKRRGDSSLPLGHGLLPPIPAEN